MKVLSWNVNGVRSVGNKGFHKWFSDVKPDIVCLQETKAHSEQLDEALLHPQGYHSFWHSAQKKGYSGVAIYAKKEPTAVFTGIGDDKIDSEGRVLGVEYGETLYFSVYFPNSQRDHARLKYKLYFCDKINSFLKAKVKKGKNVVVCGDYNIAHKEVDLKNPKTNTENPGFLPEERAWMTEFLEGGFVDGFRHFEPAGDHYTWWSYRPGVRERNIGWRIDYACFNQELANRVKGVAHFPQIMGSDHCPIGITLTK